MNYDLAKELQDADFPYKAQAFPLFVSEDGEVPARVPTLEELIEACGKNFYGVFTHGIGLWGAWKSDSDDESNEMFEGATPTEAVARLWLALNFKQHGN
jgi:hypothetical protein